MVKRFDLNADEPRLIISKAGYEASSSLADDYKSFDSNWYGTNGIKWVLRKDIPYSPNSQDIMTYVNFPFELSYRPPVIAFRTIKASWDISVIGDTRTNVTVLDHTAVSATENTVGVQALGYGTYPFWGRTSSETLYIVVFEGQAPNLPSKKCNRIVIGANPYDGRTGFWVTPPNCDAGDIKQPHIISSDNDYLKLHAVRQVPTWETGKSGQKSWHASFSFPALGYIPIVFVQQIVKDKNYRAIYPFNHNAFDAQIPRNWVHIFNDKVYFRTVPRNENDGNSEILFMVFKNKLTDTP